MPIRKIPKNYRNVTGITASSKAVGAAQFESTLERDFLKLLDFSPDVAQFEVQPVQIPWCDTHGKQRSYTPDVLVKFNTHTSRVPWLCEVKYRTDIKEHWNDLRPKFRQAIRFAKQNGWRFRLVTETEIRTQYLSNALFLSPYRPKKFSAIKIEHLLVTLHASEHTTPKALLQACSPDIWTQAEWLPVLWHLISTFRIGANLDIALTMDSPIWDL